MEHSRKWKHEHMNHYWTHSRPIICSAAVHQGLLDRTIPDHASGSEWWAARKSWRCVYHGFDGWFTTHLHSTRKSTNMIKQLTKLILIELGKFLHHCFPQTCRQRTELWPLLIEQLQMPTNNVQKTLELYHSTRPKMHQLSVAEKLLLATLKSILHQLLPLPHERLVIKLE